MGEPLFLTWFSHRRTTALCERLGLPLVELVSPRKGARRYIALAWGTFGLLWRRRPSVLIVQNPSLVLALWALILRPIFRYRLVQDAHNEAVEPYLHTSALLVGITHMLLRRCDLSIVTNEQLAGTVRRFGGRPLVMPDGIPTPPPLQAKSLGQGFHITLISTFAGDEPFEAAVEAIRRIGAEVQLHVTGNPSKLEPRIRANLPSNVTLTGFLEEHDYWTLLASSDAVMDLTTMDNCLVCGAYEAISVRRPLILSSSQASRDLFGGFAVFAENTTEGIGVAIEQMRARQAQLVAAQPAALAAFEREWQRKGAAFKGFLESSTSVASATG